jgi:transcriptional regulator with XRE-family HTH domain
MDPDDARARGARLRQYLQEHLPVGDVRSVTALARKAGLRPATVVSWTTKGRTPDNASLQRLAETIHVELSDLVAAYEGSGRPRWVLEDSDLEALLERAAQRGAELAIGRLERDGQGGVKKRRRELRI